MVDLNFLVAFWAGAISFFAPCVVPLLPAYIGYVTGVSAQELQIFGYKRYLKKILLSSLFYILGFSLIFVILGTAAAGLGVFLRRYDDVVRILGGLIILVFGLEFAGIINIPFLAYEKKLSLPVWAKNISYLRAFIVGVIFASAWTPCVGAVLGSILTLAAVSGTVFKGASLLFVYSLGISIPFMIVSLTLASATKYISFLSKHIGLVSRLAGVLLAILGILLLTDTYKFLNAWLFEVAYSLGYQVR
nr:hypothetical protein [uncultured bacterium]